MTRMITLFVAIFLSVAISVQADSAPRKLTEKRILQTAKKMPHLVAYYSKDERGRKILVVRNKDGKRADKVRRVERTSIARKTPSSRIGLQQAVSRQIPKRGIPYPNRNPQRVINPNKPVNPFRDPTAIPITPRPDSE